MTTVATTVTMVMMPIRSTPQPNQEEYNQQKTRGACAAHRPHTRAEGGEVISIGMLVRTGGGDGGANDDDAHGVYVLIALVMTTTTTVTVVMVVLTTMLRMA